MGVLQLLHFGLAKDDCDSALKLELNAKALLRRGVANLGLQELEDAQRDFLHVLQLEPNNRCVARPLPVAAKRDFTHVLQLLLIVGAAVTDGGCRVAALQCKSSIKVWLSA